MDAEGDRDRPSPGEIDRIRFVEALYREGPVADRQLNPGHFAAIARADPHHWRSLLDVAATQNWSPALAELAVSNLADARLSGEHRAMLLKGEAVPVIVDVDGQFRIPPELLGKALLEEQDPVEALVSLLDTLDVLRAWLLRENMEEVVRRSDEESLRRLEDVIPEALAYFTELLRAVRLARQAGR